MTTRRGIAPHGVGLRARGATRAETQAPTEEQTAWLLVLPAAALTALAMAFLGPPVGRLLPRTSYTYWPSSAALALRPKPTELARLGLAILGILAFAALLPLAARRARRIRVPHVRGLVLLAQGACLLALAFFWIEQSDVRHYELHDTTYFSPASIVVAATFALLATVALTRPPVVARWRALPRGRRWEIACVAAAAALTILWLLPSIFTDANIAFEPPVVPAHVSFTYDEAMSVLDGRSPLVDMATYGALIPYLVALPLSAFGGSLLAFSTLMVTLTTLALLAVYAILRRLARNPLAALALFVPFLATSLFLVQGETVERFNYATYFGMFPVRYGGPYALAWLTARKLDGDRPRSLVLLFAIAGLVVLNNTDFGLPALGATLAALVCARPPRSRSAVLALAGRLVAGLLIALALVSLLTLLRAGTLPHLDRLLAYARLFGISGFGNLPTPLFGFHLVMLATFVGSLTVAVVRATRGDDDATTTGMLAWCGIFGIGTATYFVYRSHPDTLIASFSIWSLTVAVLVTLAARTALARGSLAASLPLVALLFGFGIAACSVAQFPLPWLQVERIVRTGPQRPLASGDTVDFVHQFARRGATVAILTSIGHRLAYDSGVTNVMAYTGMLQMPATQQLQETIHALRAAHGNMIFVGPPYPPEMFDALREAGFRSVSIDQPSGLIAMHDSR
jgi:hypothetical protein